MSSSPDRRNELLELLDAMCDERMTAEQCDRLQRLVLRDRAARKLYLDYVHLHGTLLWDAAQGDGLIAAPHEARREATAAKIAIPTETAPAQADARPDRRSRRAWLMTAASVACLLMIGVIGWMLRPDGQAGITMTETSADDLSDETEDVVRRGPHYRPVELGTRPATLPEYAADVPFNPPVVAEKAAPLPTDVVAFVDGRVEQGWKDASVTPSPLAGDSEWLRRVSLDLAGRIPTAREVEEFLADSSPEKRTKVIDRLLSNDDFDRHFATVWTNLLVGRAESPIADRGALFAFLRKAFADNRGWDETVASFVAAEGSIDADPAANFLVAHLNNEAVPATAITARVFLGTQVQCMQCHHHPFNDWTQEDFWELNSFFQQTELTRNDVGKPVLVSAKSGGPTLFETRNGLMKAAYPKYEGRAISDEPTINRRAELAKLLAEGDKPQLAVAFVNRLWAHMLGAGFTTPIDDMGPHNPPSHPEALDVLSRAFVASDYDVKKLVKWIASTSAYGRSSTFNETNEADDPVAGELPLFSRAYPKPMSVEQVYDSLVVATRPESRSSFSNADRDAWVRQFVQTYETDENDESVSFSGSVPAALALMNGETVRESLRPEPGTTLQSALAAPGDETVKLKKLALATLSRPLTPKESATLRRLVRKSVAAAPPNRRQVALVEAYQDAMWAMLNSGEFSTVP
ncbi:MAG: DUF1549 and DUF1553 domain-containing protein [Planctomycetota bacterium]|nr:DUF1549 and DUF1553 domain-containing protein [Planctomycetota bacterium]